MIGGYTGYVMYLNKDLFKEAGVDLPTTDWTVEDYKNIAAQMTKKSEDGSRVDVYGTAINNYRADWINWMGNYDAEWFKDGKSNLTSPEAKQGLGVMYDLVQAGSAPSPGTVSATGDSEDRLFIVGKVAMYPSGAWCVTSFRNECDFEWDAIEMPKGTTHSSPFIGSLQCIGATSDVKDVAANILSYQYSDAGMEPIIKNTLYIPGFKHLLEREDLMAFPPSADDIPASAVSTSAASLSLTYARLVSLPSTTASSPLDWARLSKARPLWTRLLQRSTSRRTPPSSRIKNVHKKDRVGFPTLSFLLSVTLNMLQKKEKKGKKISMITIQDHAIIGSLENEFLRIEPYGPMRSASALPWERSAMRTGRSSLRRPLTVRS